MRSPNYQSGCLRHFLTVSYYNTAFVRAQLAYLKCSSFAAKLCALGRDFVIGDAPSPYVSSKGKKDNDEERPLRITYISAAPTRDNSP